MSLCGSRSIVEGWFLVRVLVEARGFGGDHHPAVRIALVRRVSRAAHVELTAEVRVTEIDHP